MAREQRPEDRDDRDSVVLRLVDTGGGKSFPARIRRLMAMAAGIGVAPASVRFDRGGSARSDRDRSACTSATVGEAGKGF
jgi:hypothetical protein